MSSKSPDEFRKQCFAAVGMKEPQRMKDDNDDLMRLALYQEQERTEKPLTAEEQKDPIMVATWEFVRARRRYIVVARQADRAFAWIAAAVSVEEDGVRRIFEVDTTWRARQRAEKENDDV